VFGHHPPKLPVVGREAEVAVDAFLNHSQKPDASKIGLDSF